MEKPSDLRRTIRRVLTSTLVALLTAAPIAGAQSGKAPSSRSFGDTAAFGVNILSIDPDSETSAFTTRSSKNLIVLEVIPGRSIEVLFPGGPGAKKLKTANTFGFSLQRFTVAHSPENDAADRAAEAAYDRCVRNADAAARRTAAATPKGVDASGKPVMRTQSEVATTTADASTSSNRCGRGSGTGARVAPKMVRLPRREPADRYLVVLSSSEAITNNELIARLEVLSTVAADVGTTIEAMASGIFFDKRAVWGGAFIPW